MKPLAPGLAVLCGLVLFVLPGLLLLARIPARHRERLSRDEALALVFGIGLAATSWVSLVLAEWSVFSLRNASLAVGGACVLGALVWARKLSWPRVGPTPTGRWMPTALVLLLAVAIDARPSEYIVGGRDPGAYVAAMALIGRTGTLVYEDPVVQSIPREDVELFYRHPDFPRFSWSRFMGFDLESPFTGRVFPQFFHLFPAFGACLFQAAGLKGALATPPLFSILAAVFVFLTFRRLLGPSPALLGTLLLLLNEVQVWFARYPVSETLSQFLIFLGLFAFTLWEEDEEEHWAAALAGVAFGLTLLVRIDSVLIAAPLAVYVAVRALLGQIAPRAAFALLAPFLLLLVHSGVHAVVFAPKYLHDIATRKYWSFPWPVWAVVIAGGLGAVIAAFKLRTRVGALLAERQESLRLVAMGAIAVLALHAYFLRPLLSTWAGGDGNDAAQVWPAVAGLLGTLGYKRLAAHDAQAFLRLGWFVHPLTLFLGTLGLLLLVRDAVRKHLFPLCVLLSFALFYFYKIRVFNDYYFALRRFLPVVLPFLFALVAFLLARMAAAEGRRRVGAALLALFLAVTQVWSSARLFFHVDWKNAVPFVSDVARRFDPQSVVIFEQPQSVHLVSLPLWAAHGLNVIELARFDPDPDKLQHLLSAWRERYHEVYFVHTWRTDLCGVFLERVREESFGTFEWQRAYGRKPEEAEFKSLNFRVSRFVRPETIQVPPMDEVDVGGLQDEMVLSAWHDREKRADSETYRWTGSCSSVYVPGAVGAKTMTVDLAFGDGRPRNIAKTVTVSLAGVEVGTFEGTNGWAEHEVTLPANLPPGVPPVLRFDVHAWKPSNVNLMNPDTRELGMMVNRITFRR